MLLLDYISKNHVEVIKASTFLFIQHDIQDDGGKLGLNDNTMTMDGKGHVWFLKQCLSPVTHL